MNYKKKEFGIELKSKILSCCSTQELAKWAFKIYSNPDLKIEDSLDPILLKLIAMEEGPEFILTEEELKLIAESLINEERQSE